MRKLNNYEAVKIDNEEDRIKFLQYLEDNTNLKWFYGDKKPTQLIEEITSNRYYPLLIESRDGKLWWERKERYLDAKTKIIPLSEFLESKVTYTREQAEKVFEDYNVFHNNLRALSREAVKFLDHKFQKSTTTLEQVTEAIKDLGDFKIEQTISGSIIIIPIKKHKQ